jgi:hypothetical protein
MTILEDSVKGFRWRSWANGKTYQGSVQTRFSHGALPVPPAGDQVLKQELGGNFTQIITVGKDGYTATGNKQYNYQNKTVS